MICDTSMREQVFASSIDIRGATDETWQHGIRYLPKNRLLKEQHARRGARPAKKKVLQTRRLP